ncbi:hypothetical protein DV711_16575 [Motiliproteus coralliicola]|uniref:Copper-binding protein n=1 Tax=Motiliproteus coralliicola TaxID=2283196 RepID=A0A369W9D7_9GAMM|nr:copper-binding protein [Motiliproteus coralliicola]RDE18277.1 hypothetical protein DV711_16575 [Motiliproteus coralliicola]
MKKCLTALALSALLGVTGTAQAHSHSDHGHKQSEEKAMDHSKMDHGKMNPGKMKMSDKPVPAVGVIKDIDHKGYVKVYHQPIEAWNMGAMQMKFKLAPSIDVHSLKVGQEIEFMTKTEGMGKYLITEIK